MGWVVCGCPYGWQLGGWQHSVHWPWPQCLGQPSLPGCRLSDLTRQPPSPPNCPRCPLPAPRAPSHRTSRLTSQLSPRLVSHLNFFFMTSARTSEMLSPTCTVAASGLSQHEVTAACRPGGAGAKRALCHLLSADRAWYRAQRAAVIESVSLGAHVQREQGCTVVLQVVGPLLSLRLSNGRPLSPRPVRSMLHLCSRAGRRLDPHAESPPVMAHTART